MPLVLKTIKATAGVLESGSSPRARLRLSLAAFGLFEVLAYRCGASRAPSSTSAPSMAAAAASERRRGVALCLVSACGFGLLGDLRQGGLPRGPRRVTSLLAASFVLAAGVLWAIVARRGAAAAAGRRRRRALRRGARAAAGARRRARAGRGHCAAVAWG
jgi:hypothetical protein